MTGQTDRRVDGTAGEAIQRGDAGDAPPRTPARRSRRKLGEGSSSVWTALKDVGGLTIVDGQGLKGA